MNVRAYNCARKPGSSPPHFVSKFVNLLPCIGGYSINKAASLIHLPGTTIPSLLLTKQTSHNIAGVRKACRHDISDCRFRSGTSWFVPDLHQSLTLWSGCVHSLHMVAAVRPTLLCPPWSWFFAIDGRSTRPGRRWSVVS
jgi:hypothetical protein